jgi:DinB family protein
MKKDVIERSTPEAGSLSRDELQTITASYRRNSLADAMPNKRSEALARRLEEGARALTAFAETLTTAEWQTRTPRDGRKVGVIVHHVGNMYPLEIDLARKLAQGEAIAGVTWDDVHAVNAAHAKEFDGVTKEEALAFLRRNSAAAAEAVRALSDEELDRAAPVSLNSDAPLTCQFFVEDHALRHSFHHLARLKAALGR